MAWRCAYDVGNGMIVKTLETDEEKAELESWVYMCHGHAIFTWEMI